MKVLHFFKTFWPDSLGGIERVIDTIASGLVDSGVKSTVLTLSSEPQPGELFRNGYRVVQARKNFEFASTGISFDAIGKFRELARESDIIHYHFPWPFMDLAHWTTRHGKPSIVTYHADALGKGMFGRTVLTPLYGAVARRFLASVDKVVATSPQYASSSPLLRGLGREVDFIPLGISDTSPPAPLPAHVDAMRARVGQDFFLFVGVLRPYKGLETLIEAARHTGHKVIIAGDGKERDRLEAIIRHQGVSNVVMLGHVSEEDKSALLALCKAFAFPSNNRAEAFGISLVEASRFGKPMISCDLTTGTSYVNIDGVTGLVVPASDSKAFGEAMTALASDAELVRGMGKAARARYERHFRASIVAMRYLEAYESLLAARSISGQASVASFSPKASR
ncbi:MAG: glycosyltransferase [Nitratireductor sp.]|nr:glycosyltransferase [Nitratireductor sp.]